ncbi:MAG: hypothetical protein PHG23_02105 [Candidatus Pacebacteria bacterium]|nr:hypothetical protein [Candidatus Paceibacterota bacterium]
MLAKITEFVKENQAEIALVIAVILVALLAFSFGYWSAVNDMKKPIIIEQTNDGIQK